MESQLWYLDNVDLSHLFCPNRPNSERMADTELPAKRYVYLPGEPARNVYLVKSGRIKVGTYGEGGKEITKAILTAGEVFGELALMGETNRRDFAYVVETAHICGMDREELQRRLHSRSDLQLFFMKLIGRRRLRLERRLENLLFKSSRSRITDFLHELAQTRGRAVGMEREVTDMLTHQEIADLTGTSRQTVNSVLNDLRRRRVVSFNRKRLLVRDMGQLRSS